MVVVLHLVDTLPQVGMLQGLQTGEASAGLGVKYCGEEAGGSIWGCTACSDSGQHWVLHCSLFTVRQHDSINLHPHGRHEQTDR